MTKILIFDSLQPRVKEYPKDRMYLVSNTGEVYSKAWGKLRKLSVFYTRDGYPKVKLGSRGRTIHRLVAETFLDNEENLDTVDHIDNNKLNNNLSNLRWLSREDNAGRAGRGSYKLVDPEGSVHEFTGQADFCRKNGLTQANISKVLCGERLHHKGWTAYEIKGE